MAHLIEHHSGDWHAQDGFTHLSDPGPRPDAYRALSDWVERRTLHVVGHVSDVEFSHWVGGSRHHKFGVADHWAHLDLDPLDRRDAWVAHVVADSLEWWISWRLLTTRPLDPAALDRS